MNRRAALFALSAAALCGCSKASDAARSSTITVFKTESCGCCKLWVTHLENAGFATQVHDTDNLGPVKERAGVPYGLGSCHTAEVGDYFVEGHVPAADIERLLREKPDAKGLTVPGMPVGSPGMEVASGQIQAYDVLLVAKDGTTSIYAHYAGT